MPMLHGKVIYFSNIYTYFEHVSTKLLGFIIYYYQVKYLIFINSHSESIYFVCLWEHSCLIILTRSCWVNTNIYYILTTYHFDVWLHLPSVYIYVVASFKRIGLVQSFGMAIVALCILSMNTRSVLIVLSFSRISWCYVLADWLWLWLLFTPLVSFIDVSNFLRTETKSFIHFHITLWSMRYAELDYWMNYNIFNEWTKERTTVYAQRGNSLSGNIIIIIIVIVATT